MCHLLHVLAIKGLGTSVSLAVAGFGCKLYLLGVVAFNGLIAIRTNTVSEWGHAVTVIIVQETITIELGGANQMGQTWVKLLCFSRGWRDSSKWFNP